MDKLTLPKARIWAPRWVRVVFAMMLREMATTYGRSSLGYMWAIIEPVGAIAVLSIAFSIALQNPALGQSFALFYATGYMPFMLYNTMQNRIGATVRENKQLLFYPRVTYVDAMIARFILTFVTQLFVAVIVFGGIIVTDGVNQRLDFMLIFSALLIAAVLGLGVGVLNCILIHLMPSWRQLWSVFTRPLFLVSCIFFMFDNLPIWAQKVLWFNPLVHIVGLMRRGFYTIYEGDYIVLAYPLAITGLTLFFGLALLRRYSQDLINS